MHKSKCPRLPEGKHKRLRKKEIAINNNIEFLGCTARTLWIPPRISRAAISHSLVGTDRNIHQANAISPPGLEAAEDLSQTCCDKEGWWTPVHLPTMGGKCRNTVQLHWPSRPTAMPAHTLRTLVVILSFSLHFCSQSYLRGQSIDWFHNHFSSNFMHLSSAPGKLRKILNI